jgi:outer membrane protein
MKSVSSLFLVLLFSLGLSSVYADPAKMGVVDLQRIMQTSTQMKAIQQKLEKEFQPRRNKLVAMEQNLKKDMEKFKREAAVMSMPQKKDTERKIVAAQQTFEREGQQYQQELSTAHNEAMEELYGKIRKAINKVAKDQQYDIILQKDATPFSVAKFEITDQVMKEID